MSGPYLDVIREGYFPNLRRENYRITSEETDRYNCIAHASGESDAPWWPVASAGVYWPDGLPRHEDLQAFVEMYESHGYAICESTELEAGFERVAIYVDGDGEPTHAARQLPNGRWTSKLGAWEDIEHASLGCLEAGEAQEGLGYGRVACVMRRKQRGHSG